MAGEESLVVLLTGYEIARSSEGRAFQAGSSGHNISAAQNIFLYHCCSALGWWDS